MLSRDLEVFHGMPFFFWVKDEEGRYIWVNQALSEMARQDLVGKTDRDLGWAADADAPVPGSAKATLNVCKFVGELDGKKGVFGVSLVID